jgi:hypothetical protein
VQQIWLRSSFSNRDKAGYLGRRRCRQTLKLYKDAAPADIKHYQVRGVKLADSHDGQAKIFGQVDEDLGGFPLIRRHTHRVTSVVFGVRYSPNAAHAVVSGSRTFGSSLRLRQTRGPAMTEA